jgi:Flp pilus assembly secretin CpaC
MVSQQEQLSLQGIAGLAQLPILGGATSLHNRQTDDQELLITIRPHLVRGSFHDPEAGTAFLPPAR